MKVLIVSTSPRLGGNSDLLADEFMNGATDANHQVEKVYLNDYNIHYCSGCGYCFEHKGSCSQKDEMSKLAAKMVEADCIVLATPVYFYSMSAQCKTLIDRLCPYTTVLKGKTFYFIASAADGEVEVMRRCFEGMQGLVDCIDHATVKGKVYGINAYEKGAIKTSDAMQKAYQMGSDI